jgi:hypothetical protein
MKWQDYQDAVGELYIQLGKGASIKKNILIPDKVTGQNRQVDVWLISHIAGHQINMLIDAKLRSSPIDVKDVEEILALSEAVKASKAVIVTNYGWTAPAKLKAEHHLMDLKLFSIEEALDVLVPNKWFMCYDCDDCVIMDKHGVLFRSDINLFFFWVAGSCRECKNLYLNCDECGSRVIIEDKDPWKCYCGHSWKLKNEQLYLKLKKKKKYIRIDNAAKPTVEFLMFLRGYDPKYWRDIIEDQVMCVGDDKGGSYSFIIPSKKF